MKSFTGISVDGFISATRVNGEILVEPKNNSVLFVCNINIFRHLHTISAVALQARSIIYHYTNHNFVEISVGG